MLVAVSGGPDSVALLRALVATSPDAERNAGQIVVAHFNHQLRGEESDADQRFVEQLCRSLGVLCKVGRNMLAGSASSPDTPSRSNTPHPPNSSEDHTRRLRYAFLQSTAEQLGLRYVATAHTADDQAETILHRVVRGTGLAGLSGIARARPLGPAVSLIRPLLGVRRSELLAYLAQMEQPYRIDASNADTAFTRNRIRHALLPQLADAVHPEAVEAICRLGQLAAEAQAVIAPLVDELVQRCVIHESADEVHLAIAPLVGQGPGQGRGQGQGFSQGPGQGQPLYLVRELFAAIWRRRGWPLRAMGMAEWDALACLALARMAQPAATDLRQPAKRDFPGGIEAEVLGDTLRLRARRM